MISSVAGDLLREATLSNRDLDRIIKRWREDKDVPLYMNYAPTLRASQLRALVSEGIRRHNVGLVVIDHFRMWDLDRRLDNKLDEDEEKVRFLKEQIASPLNVAVICLAHTRKPDPSSNGRPKMSDLRGSYQVAAHADFVSFIFRPAMYATPKQIEQDSRIETAAEMIWAKNRHSGPGNLEFHFDATSMLITDSV
jgi:replicative DNA helicase